MKSFSSLLLPLENVPNARELGGYVMNDGRKIRRGLLLRCGTLSRASDNDLSVLHDVYHVAHTFDYRTNHEQTISPDRNIQGSDYISLPCIDPNNDIYQGTEFAEKAGRPGFLDFVVEYSFCEEAKMLSRLVYSNLVISEYTQLQYGTFLNYAAKDEDGALLWHCSQGKDRTGLAAAFLLYILGASRDLIIKDFDYSNVYYSELLADIRQKVIDIGGSEKELDVVDALIGASTRRFIDALDLIEHEYGSMDDYVHNQLCITDNDIINIRRRFLQ